MASKMLIRRMIQDHCSPHRPYDISQPSTSISLLWKSRNIAPTLTSPPKFSHVDFSNGSTIQGLPDHRFGSSGQMEMSSYRYDADSTCDRFSQTDLKNDPHVSVYNQTTTVSLRSSMQSQVPRPYGRTPSHMNMPGGVNRREDKYIQGRLSDIVNQRKLHTVRFLSASVPPPSSTMESDLLDEHGNPTYCSPTNVSHLLARPCPQGVQGDDCASFKLWLSNCISTGNNENCEALANEYIAGRKTLAQVFAEYDMEIRKVRGQTDKVRMAATPRLSDPSQSDSSSNAASQSQDSEAPPKSEGEGPPKKKRQQQIALLKAAVRDYGSTVVVFHVAISLVSLGGFYLLVSSNVDLSSLIEFLGLNFGKASSSVESASTIAVAYAIHKVFAPVRIGITLTCAPVIVRSLRSRGILKPPKVPSRN